MITHSELIGDFRADFSDITHNWLYSKNCFNDVEKRFDLIVGHVIFCDTCFRNLYKKLYMRNPRNGVLHRYIRVLREALFFFI